MTLHATRMQLASRPVGLPTDANFEFVEVALASPEAGEALVENLYFSVDPYHREEMDAGHWPLHDQLEGGTIGRVLSSNVDGVHDGDLLLHYKAYATHAVVEEFRVLQPASEVPLTAYLGVLGGTGLTAWVGVVRVARLQPGESIFITAAAGAVGTAAAHFARALGASRISGSTGSDEKARRLLAGPFTDVINYRTSPLLEAIEQNAYDVVLEGVGGEQLAAAIAGAKDPGGRIAWVGAVAQYNDLANPPAAPLNLYDVVLKQLRLEGYMVMHHQDARSEFEKFVIPLLQAGTIPIEQTMTIGLQTSVAALRSVLTGGNFGKQIVALGEPAVTHSRSCA